MRGTGATGGGEEEEGRMRGGGGGRGGGGRGGEGRGGVGEREGTMYLKEVTQHGSDVCVKQCC